LCIETTASGAESATARKYCSFSRRVLMTSASLGDDIVISSVQSLSEVYPRSPHLTCVKLDSESPIHASTEGAHFRDRSDSLHSKSKNQDRFTPFLSNSQACPKAVSEGPALSDTSALNCLRQSAGFGNTHWTGPKFSVTPCIFSVTKPRLFAYSRKAVRRASLSAIPRRIHMCCRTLFC